MTLPLNKYHRRICTELSKRGIQYAEEYPVGQRQVDIYIGDMKRIVELDGPLHWPSKDRERDEELRASRPDLEIVHIKVGTPVAEAMEVILGKAGN